MDISQTLFPPGTGARPGAVACWRGGGGDDHRERNFSGSVRDDAGGGVGATGISRLDGWRAAFFFRRAYLCRTGRYEAAGGRRVCLRSRCLRAAGGIPLFVDNVSDLQARFDCDHHDWPGADPRNISGLFFFLASSFLAYIFLASIHAHLRATGGDRSHRV